MHPGACCTICICILVWSLSNSLGHMPLRTTYLIRDINPIVFQDVQHVNKIDASSLLYMYIHKIPVYYLSAPLSSTSDTSLASVASMLPIKRPFYCALSFYLSICTPSNSAPTRRSRVISKVSHSSGSDFCRAVSF